MSDIMIRAGIAIAIAVACIWLAERGIKGRRQKQQEHGTAEVKARDDDASAP